MFFSWDSWEACFISHLSHENHEKKKNDITKIDYNSMSILDYLMR